MVRILKIFFLCFFINITAYGQAEKNVVGTVIDTTGIGIAGVHVKLLSFDDTISTTTRENGDFVLDNVKAPKFTLIVSHLGFRTLINTYSFKKGLKWLQLEEIIMKEEFLILDEIMIKARNPIEIKEDTIQYNTEFFPVKEGSFLEELIKILPGFTVDRNGNVMSHGKNISNVKVNGIVFFGGEVQTATRNLTVEMVENIQIINDYGDLANRTGIKTGLPIVTLNINLKEGKDKGLFGQVTAGVGNESRYLASGSINFFEGDKQLSFYGSINNTNTDAFGAGNGNFSSTKGGGDGISTNGSLGLNYREKWGEKITAYGNYIYSSDKNNIERSVSQQSILQDEITLYEQEEETESNYYEHNIRYNIEYQHDQRNFLKISPYLIRKNSELDNVSVFSIQSKKNSRTTSGETINTDKTKVSSIGAEMLYNHKFHKEGRNIIFNSSLNFHQSKQQQQLYMTNFQVLPDSSIGESNVDQKVLNGNLSTSSKIEFAFTESLNDHSFIQFNYNMSHSKTENILETQDGDFVRLEFFKIDSLSDRYRNHFTTQRIGLTYQLIKDKYNFTIGLLAQPVSLKVESVEKNIQTKKNIFNIIPEARLFYNISNGKTINLNYNVTALEPAFNQLQPVTNYTNPQYPITGNPDLKPEINHQLNLTYNQFILKTKSVFFINCSISKTQNRIVTNVIHEPKDSLSGNNALIQETTYLNTDGYYRINGNYVYTRPLVERKLSISINGSINQNNNMYFINHEKIYGSNLEVSQGLNLRVNLSDLLNTEIGGSYSFNNTNYSTKASPDYNIHSFKVSITGENYLFKKLTIGYYFVKTFNHGFTRTFLANPAILNLYLEYHFLKNKNASLRFQCFDLFKQNIGINRTIDGNNIIDNRINRLSRYFLLTFSVRLQKMN